MIDPAKALALVIEETARGDGVQVPIEQALGLTLAENIHADNDYPPFDRASMDGYAICLADAGKEANVIDVVTAGHASNAKVSPGHCIEIMTGGPCPSGSEAVVMKEEVQRKGDRALMPAQVVRGQHIVKRGQECRAGSLVLNEGTTVSPIAMAALASFGLQSVRVVSPPSVAVITTGDEIAAGHGAPNAVQVRNSNGPMLVAQARAYPLANIQTTHANDTMESLAAALDRTNGADIVVLTGGVSVGIRDLVPAALAEYGASQVFHKVAQKPGKPLLFAKRRGQLFFGLPGKPAGSYLCFHRYVAAALRKKLGRDPCLPVGRGRLAQGLDEQSDRVLFVPSRVTWQAQHWHVECLSHRGAAGIFPILTANAYAVFSPDAQRRAGDEVVFELMQPMPA